MKSIGFAGTAKNTGKTTSLLSVISQFHLQNRQIALTSIGYDGENRDTVTGLPKPRITLKEGDLVATAEECLKTGTARLESIQTTSITTILGKVVIARVEKPGTVLVAGPNRRRDLEHLMHLFTALDADLLLVDGALNRLIPMIACDGLVLSTGAAFDPQIEKISRHAAALVDLFHLPLSKADPSHGSNIRLKVDDDQWVSLPISALISRESLKTLVNSAGDHQVKEIVLKSAQKPELIMEFLSGRAGPVTITCGDPLRMIAGGDPLQWSRLRDEYNTRMQIMNPVHLIAMTVNPFYPRWMNRGFEYEPALVDAPELVRAVTGAVKKIPVFDIMQSPTPDWVRLFGYE